MATSTLIDRINRLVQKKHLLKHQFYQAWTEGTLSLDALRDYATQYYKHVQAFPTYLSAVHAHCNDLEVRRHLVENLNDEEGSDPTHPALWLQFAEALGLDEADVENAPVNDYTQITINEFRSICSTGIVAEGVAALYSYESQIPEVSQSKIDGLKTFYGFSDPKAWEYFTVHIAADVEHADAEKAILDRLSKGLNEESILVAADRALEAINGLLTGIAEQHGINCEKISA